MSQTAAPRGLKWVRAAAAPAAKRALMHSGVYAALRRLSPSRKVAILRYHAVCARDAGYADPSICVSPAIFEQHVRYLARHYAVLPLPQVAAALVHGNRLPANTVAITFDDGYADNLQAAQVLAAQGLTATFYLTAGCLAGGAPFWPAELRGLVAALPGPALEVDVAGAPLVLPLATAADRAAAVKRLTRVFKSHPIPVRERVRDALRAAAGYRPIPSVMLTWDQVREMHRLGMTIGGHTLTHPNLPSAGLEAAAAEITGCRLRLEQELGAEVTMFSYPNGGAETYFTRGIQDAVRHAGFTAATTSRNGFADGSSDPYALERVQVREPLEELVFAMEVERFAFKPQAKAGAAGR